MKAVILAAGKGIRMGKYTQNLPKGMLNINGKTLIERQLEILGSLGIKDIAIVTGYASKKIKYKGVKYFYNKNFNETNMLESLMCAESFISNSDVLLCYSDILYTKNLIQQLLKANGNICIAVDEDWKKLWNFRYGKINYDLESLSIKNGFITDIGKEVYNAEKLYYRYIGVLKFSIEGITKLINTYHSRKGKNWTQSGKIFKQGYITDILYEIIKDNYSLNAVITKGNWYEFDTEKDYEVLMKSLKNNQILKDLQIDI